jgi:hypothetical protein
MKKALTLFAAVMIFTAGSMTMAQEPAVLTVIHGISGLPEPVDVYANDTYLFSFDFNESVDSLEVPADTYFIEVKLMGDTVLSGTAMLEEGKNYTAIAHFTYNESEKGAEISLPSPGIKLSFFENDISDLGRWAIRLSLRHTADAPAVDVALRRGLQGNRFFTKAKGLSNNDGGDPSEFGPADFWWGNFTAVFFPAGTDTEVFSSGLLKLQKGNYYIVYPIGSIGGGTFTLFVQTIDLRS